MQSVYTTLFALKYKSQDYWNKVILKKSSGIDESGTIVWQLILSLAIAWLIVLGMVIKGIQVKLQWYKTIKGVNSKNNSRIPFINS